MFVVHSFHFITMGVLNLLIICVFCESRFRSLHILSIVHIAFFCAVKAKENVSFLSSFSFESNQKIFDGFTYIGKYSGWILSMLSSVLHVGQRLRV